MTLGSIVRELHRSLLLSLTAETHSTTLTQLIKATALLTANSPYHQLSEGYVTKIATTLLRFSRHKGEDQNALYAKRHLLALPSCEIFFQIPMSKWLASPAMEQLSP